MHATRVGMHMLLKCVPIACQRVCAQHTKYVHVVRWCVYTRVEIQCVKCHRGFIVHYQGIAPSIVHKESFRRQRNPENGISQRSTHCFNHPSRVRRHLFGVYNAGLIRQLFTPLLAASSYVPRSYNVLQSCKTKQIRDL